jgi:hypothetical protein
MKLKIEDLRLKIKEKNPFALPFQRGRYSFQLYQRGIKGDLKRPNTFLFCLLIIPCILLLALPTLAQQDEKFTIARLKYGGGGDWYYGQTQILNLLKGLNERTNVDAAKKQEVIELTDKKLYSYPFIYMTGHGNVAFTEEEVKALRLYLIRGGFLWANDDYGMDKSFRREMKRIFPDKDLVEVPFDAKPPKGYGIFHEGRIVVFYDYESDIADGLEDPEVHNDPPEKREQALRMAINMVIYTLTN